MNKIFFQQLFCKTTGQVYTFLGTVPADTDPVSYITGQFVSAADHTQLNTVVVVLPQQNVTVIYVDDATTITSDEFAFITDLIPDPVVEEVIEQAVENTTPPL
jgi:hypothetical protein